MASPTKLRQELYALAKTRGFVDPLSGRAPSTEESLTGVCSFFAQRRKIRWEEVPLYDVTYETKICNAKDLIDPVGFFLTEYRLLHTENHGIGIWQGMPADLVHANQELNRVVLFESKLGGKVGYEEHSSETNQFARQIDYLVNLANLRSITVNYVLLTTRYMLEEQWYKDTLVRSLRFNGRENVVKGFVAAWEDIVNAADA